MLDMQCGLFYDLQIAYWKNQSNHIRCNADLTGSNAY